MNRNCKINLISMSLASLILTTNITPVLALNIDKTENQNISKISFNEGKYSLEVVTELKIAISKLELYEKEKDIKYLRESIDVFSNIPVYMTKSDSDNASSGEGFDDIFFKIRDYIYALDDNIQHTNIIYFGEKIFLGWRLNKSVTTYSQKYLNRELVEYNKGRNSKAQPRLDYLKDLCEYFKINPDLNFDSGIVPDINIDKPSKPNKPTRPNKPVGNPTNPDYNFKPNAPKPTNPSEGGNTPDKNFSPFYNGNFIDYKKKENKCYRVSVSYKEGKEVSRRETLVPKSDYVKCGIYDYVHSNIKRPMGNTLIDKDYIEDDQNLDSKYSIYYTVNKNSSNPYYYDTGIKTSAKDNTVSYNQLKDALYQLSIKADGYAVIDNEKSLIVIEGKPVVVKKEKDSYSKNEVERLLNSFSKAGLKIMESSAEKQYSLENSLISGEVKTVKIDGEKFDLSSPALLMNNTVMIPIEDLALNLGGELTKEGEYTVIKIKDSIIKVKSGSLKYIDSDTERKFKTAPLIKDSYMYVELTPIATIIGYEVGWDSDLGEMIFNKK